MGDRINEIYNRIRNKKDIFKCIAYIDDNKGGDNLVESFEISEYSIRTAYKTSYDLLKFKYPGMGLDIRIHKH